MPKKNRLTRDEIKDFKGKRLHGALFSLTYAPLSSSHAKIAITVSKKVSPKAVTRNLVRRRARSACAKVKVSGAFLFSAKQSAATSSFSAIETDIRALIERASRSY